MFWRISSALLNFDSCENFSTHQGAPSASYKMCSVVFSWKMPKSEIKIARSTVILVLNLVIGLYNCGFDHREFSSLRNRSDHSLFGSSSMKGKNFTEKTFRKTSLYDYQGHQDDWVCDCDCASNSSHVISDQLRKHPNTKYIFLPT